MTIMKLASRAFEENHFFSVNNPAFVARSEWPSCERGLDPAPPWGSVIE